MSDDRRELADRLEAGWAAYEDPNGLTVDMLKAAAALHLDEDHYEAWKADQAKWKADRNERDAWKETARQYAQNADYWRDRFNDFKASFAVQAFTAPDEDELVMLDSLVARIADLAAERDAAVARAEAAEAEAQRLRAACLRVVQAWMNPGVRPDIHRRAQAQLRRGWPVLASAIAALLAEQPEGET